MPDKRKHRKRPRATNHRWSDPTELDYLQAVAKDEGVKSFAEFERRALLLYARACERRRARAANDAAIVQAVATVNRSVAALTRQHSVISALDEP